MKFRGKKGVDKNQVNSSVNPNKCVSFRDEVNGKIHSKSSCNYASLSRMEHLKKLAKWAVEEAPIPSLAAFYGRQFASAQQALGVRRDLSIFSCHRCETLLSPGCNCTVRIQKVRRKTRRRRNKAISLPRNNVVYNCHFCSHKNLIRGTPRGYVKQLCQSRENSLARQAAPSALPPVSVPESSGTELLDSNRRRQTQSPSTKPNDSEIGVSSSSRKKKKRKKTSFCKLKEIMANNRDANIAPLAIPFLI